MSEKSFERSEFNVSNGESLAAWSMTGIAICGPRSDYWPLIDSEREGVGVARCASEGETERTGRSIAEESPERGLIWFLDGDRFGQGNDRGPQGTAGDDGGPWEAARKLPREVRRNRTGVHCEGIEQERVVGDSKESPGVHGEHGLRKCR